jgi:hypothetical protein
MAQVDPISLYGNLSVAMGWSKIDNSSSYENCVSCDEFRFDWARGLLKFQVVRKSGQRLHLSRHGGPCFSGLSGQSDDKEAE